MFNTDLSTRSCDGRAVVASRGELDSLEFIDSSGVAAFARGRGQADEAGHLRERAIDVAV